MPSLGMRQIQVRATADASEPDGVRFELFEGGAKVPGDTLRSAKGPGNSKQNDFHEFRFHLHEHGVDLSFRKPASAAMTVVGGNADIEPISVSQNGKMLDVRNFNRSAVENKFELHFETQAHPPQTVTYDPIWANQNGGL